MKSVFQSHPNQFLGDIYATPLGRMRVELLLEDLGKFVRANKIKSILDIGAGHAPVTLSLLKKFPHLTATLLDPSQKLLRESSSIRTNLRIGSERVNTVQGSFATLKNKPVSADLVVCHAVANWTSRPMQFINELARYAKRHARYLSLVVGSSLAKAIRFSTRGKLADVQASALHPGHLVGSLIGEAKVRPLHPDAVAKLLEKKGTVLQQSGVRVFADYLPTHSLKSPAGYRVALALERRVRNHPDWWRLGQLVHFLVRMRHRL